MAPRPRKRPRLVKEESEEPSWITRCLCGDNDNVELGAGLMIMCETCDVWQHGPCMGITTTKAVPEHYYCEQCRPDLHTKLLSAKAKASKPPKAARPKLAKPKSAKLAPPARLASPPPPPRLGLPPPEPSTATAPIDLPDPVSTAQPASVIDAPTIEAPPMQVDLASTPAIPDDAWSSLVASFGLTDDDLAHAAEPATEDGAPPADLMASLGLSFEDFEAVGEPPPDEATDDLLASMGLTAADLDGVAGETTDPIQEEIARAAIETLQSALFEEEEEEEWEDAEDEDLLDATRAAEDLFSDDEDDEGRPEDWGQDEPTGPGDDNIVVGAETVTYSDGHLDRLVHLCPETGCGKRFVHLRNLTAHHKEHSEPKPYVCVRCTEGFPRAHDLKRHIQTHVAIRPHVCQGCDRTFARSDALKRHQANVKSDEVCRTTPGYHDEEGERRARAEAKKLLAASLRPIVAAQAATDQTRMVKPRTVRTTGADNDHDVVVEPKVTLGQAALQTAHIVSIVTQMLIDLPRGKASGHEDEEAAAADAVLEVLRSVKLSKPHAILIQKVLTQVTQAHEQARPPIRTYYSSHLHSLLAKTVPSALSNFTSLLSGMQSSNLIPVPKPA